MLKQEVVKPFVRVTLITFLHNISCYKNDVFNTLPVLLLGYLLPIINNLLAEKQLLSRPPYAVVLLPSIELCHQASNY